MRTLTIAALAISFLTTALSAQETPQLDPKGAWEAMQNEMLQARQARDHAKLRSLQQTKPGEFLEAWDEAEGKAEGEQLYYLGLFYGMAARHLDAIGAHRTCATNEELPGDLREQARGAFAGSVYSAVNAHDLEADAALKAVAEVEAFAEAAEKSVTKGAMLQRAAHCLSALGAHDAAIERFLGAARANPALAYGAGRGAMGELMGGTWEMAAYDGLRARGKALVTELTALQQKYIVELQAKGDEKTIGRAQSSLKRLADMTRPLEMLGKPAPGWTLVKAYGKTSAIEDHRGKVVMLDFWATWCGWCIKSFPAIRDVLADYEGKDFRIVGVTAPANSVTESRYALDEDLKAKGEGKPPVGYHRFPGKGTPEEQATFRALEQEILSAFIANHEMTWDVVMIDAAEPGPKYGLTGWPHAVVLDKLGRVRYFKRGALLTDRPEGIAKLKKVVDSLLAEEVKDRPAAPAFTLTDVEGAEHALSSFRGKHVVLEWINHGCPYVKKHYNAGTMQALQKRYGEKGVVWLSICSSAPGKQGHMSPDAWKEKNAEVGSAATAVLLDADGPVGRLYGAGRTPHMVVIDPAGRILYQGAIDDRPNDFEPEKVRSAKSYVSLVLDAVLAGEAPPVEKTIAYG